MTKIAKLLKKEIKEEIEIIRKAREEAGVKVQTRCSSCRMEMPAVVVYEFSDGIVPCPWCGKYTDKIIKK